MTLNFNIKNVMEFLCVIFIIFNVERVSNLSSSRDKKIVFIVFFLLFLGCDVCISPKMKSFFSIIYKIYFPMINFSTLRVGWCKKFESFRNFQKILKNIYGWFWWKRSKFMIFILQISTIKCKIVFISAWVPHCCLRYIFLYEIGKRFSGCLTAYR